MYLCKLYEVNQKFTRLDYRSRNLLVVHLESLSEFILNISCHEKDKKLLKTTFSQHMHSAPITGSIKG